MSKIQDVFQFMQVMDQIKLIPKDYDNLSDKDKINYTLRLILLVEQVEKLFDASFDSVSTFSPVFSYLKTLIEFHSKDIKLDRNGIVEALVDQEYVNLGTAIHLQLPINETFPIVHTNNMNKYDKYGGRVNKRADGKVTLPLDYESTPINVERILVKDDGSKS